MKLVKNKNYTNDEYRCEITYELDNMCNYINEAHGYVNYLLDLKGCENDDLWWFGIRVPGRTVGVLATDDNGVIVKCTIGSDCVGSRYPDNVNEIIKKYIGKQLEF